MDRRLITEDLRLVILRCLVEAGPAGANDSIIYKEIVRLRQPSTRAQYDGAVAWLAEQGLIRAERIDGMELLSLQVLEMGAEVAEGRASYPGVARPSFRHG